MSDTLATTLIEVPSWLAPWLRVVAWSTHIHTEMQSGETHHHWVRDGQSRTMQLSFGIRTAASVQAEREQQGRAAAMGHALPAIDPDQ